jgi:cob(I)alamin adenosyltransferase
MPRLTKIATRTGDDGTTALTGGRRVGKDARRVAAYGTVDETNSAIGVALACGLDAAVAAALSRVQNELFHLGAALSAPPDPKRQGPRIEKRHLALLDADLAALNGRLPPLVNFVLPGGSPGAAALHAARTACRRAERLVVALARREKVPVETVPYLNRLSDLLFVCARAENAAKGVTEPTWDSRA